MGGLFPRKKQPPLPNARCKILGGKPLAPFHHCPFRPRVGAFFSLSKGPCDARLLRKKLAAQKPSGIWLESRQGAASNNLSSKCFLRMRQNAA